MRYEIPTELENVKIIIEKNLRLRWFFLATFSEKFSQLMISNFHRQLVDIKKFKNVYKIYYDNVLISSSA